jgi:large subunit ribosomal protein L9
MQIILLERIGKLGQMGDVVTVKDGYARNYLLPQGKALRATKPNLERFERERVQLEALNLERKKEADAVAARIDKQNIIIIRQAGETGQLYGSVSTRDIASSVSDAGYKVGRQQILLDRPIKSLGVHPVRMSLPPDGDVAVYINLARDWRRLSSLAPATWVCRGPPTLLRCAIASGWPLRALMAPL